MTTPRPGHGEKLSRKQEHAIAALLSCPTILGAATACEVSEAALHRWLKLPAFQAAYRQARAAVVSQAISQLQQATGEAVKTLCEVMNDRDVWASVRVTAARTVLEMALKGIELDDFGARLDALERQSNGLES